MKRHQQQKRHTISSGSGVIPLSPPTGLTSIPLSAMQAPRTVENTAPVSEPAPQPEPAPEPEMEMAKRDSERYYDEPVTLRKVRTIMEARGCTLREIGEVLGCSGSGLLVWLQQGRCPRSIERSAILALQSLQSPVEEPKEERAVFVLRPKTAEERERIEMALKLTNIGAAILEG